MIAWARNNNVMVAHVKVGFDDGYHNCSQVSPMFSKAREFGVLKLSAWGCEFHKDMDVQP